MVPKYPCRICNKAVRSNSKAIQCEMCLFWVHVNCQKKIYLTQYITTIQHHLSFSWTCESCDVGPPTFESTRTLRFILHL